jgi:hypothetical protein
MSDYEATMTETIAYFRKSFLPMLVKAAEFSKSPEAADRDSIYVAAGDAVVVFAADRLADALYNAIEAGFDLALQPGNTIWDIAHDELSDDLWTMAYWHSGWSYSATPKVNVDAFLADMWKRLEVMP